MIPYPLDMRYGLKIPRNSVLYRFESGLGHWLLMEVSGHVKVYR